WTEKSGDDERTYRDRERYFKLKQYFIQESSKKDGSVIRPGRHIFLFRFQLPRQSLFKYVCLFVCFIQQPQSGTQDKRMKLFSSGKMSLTVSTDKTGYMQGETIRVFVDIDNSSSRDVKLKYSLKQQQTFIAGIRNKRGLKYIIEETRDRIPSGEKSKFIVNMKLPHDLTVTIENCRILKVQYELKVYLDVSFASDPEVRFPMVILPAEQQCCPWQGPPGGFQPYPPPQPKLVPIPGELPPPPAGLNDPTVLPHLGAAAGVYPNPHAIQPGFHPFPSAPVYDPKH
uniref:Arrestin C-terminal-like domain-containing protein n=1 Tax=Sinocyclocheilus grahami TaxID=75366 RepID=A0A672T2W1_SINGR